MRLVLALLVIQLLTGCASLGLQGDVSTMSYDEYKASTSPGSIKDFNATGKFIFFIENKGFSGKLTWKSNNNKDTIFLLNPFNTVVAKIKLDALQKKFSIFVQDNDKNLENLNAFLRRNDNIFLMREFSLNRPLSENKDIAIINNEWKITYHDSLPNNRTKKIIFKKGNIRLELLFISWVN